jgi:hypothetical protein
MLKPKTTSEKKREDPSRPREASSGVSLGIHTPLLCILFLGRILKMNPTHLRTCFDKVVKIKKKNFK